MIRPHDQHDRGSGYGVHRCAGKSGRRRAGRFRIGIRVKNPATKTALGPMVIVAADQNENPPLIQDELAYKILPASGKVTVIAAKWRPLGRLLIGATEKKIPGLWASMLCRKRYIDEKLQGADSQIDAAVILGAGFDTRAYRLPVLAETPVYELDLPTNINRKRTRLTKLFGEVPANVTLVPIDFETQDLADILADHGYRPKRPTFFVCEAVTQYLTEPGVRKTFDFLATAAVGSHLVFTLCPQGLPGGDRPLRRRERVPGIRGEAPTLALRDGPGPGRQVPRRLRLERDRADGSTGVHTPIPQAQWPRVASVGDRTFRLRQKDLTRTMGRVALQIGIPLAAFVYDCLATSLRRQTGHYRRDSLLWL